MEAESYIKGKIKCSQFEFPMRFYCMDKNAEIEIMFGYNSMPTSRDYHEKSYKYNTYIKGSEKYPDIEYVGVMLITHRFLNTKIGCAFNLERQRKRNVYHVPSYKNKTREMVMTKGVNYDDIIAFKDTKYTKKIRKMMQNKFHRRVIDNIREISSPDYNERRAKGIKDNYDNEMQKIENAKQRRDELWQKRLEYLKTRKTRNQIVREKQERLMEVSLKFFVDYSALWAWMKLLKYYAVMMELKRAWIRVKQRKIMGEKMLWVGSIFAKFWVPLKRFKKTNRIGCLERSHL